MAQSKKSWMQIIWLEFEWIKVLALLLLIQVNLRTSIFWRRIFVITLIVHENYDLEKIVSKLYESIFVECRLRITNFFALMDINDDERLQNFFWANICSRTTYKYFEDAVTFDTTYLTNKYIIPFALFVDKNHYV